MLNGRHFPVTCEDTGEICYNYNQYLKSEHWRNFRKRYYSSKLFNSSHEYKKFGGINGVCLCCKKDTNLNLHHITYIGLGKERLRDVIPVCENCHYLIHTLINLQDEGSPRLLKKASWMFIHKHYKKIKKFKGDMDKIIAYFSLFEYRILPRVNSKKSPFGEFHSILSERL